MILKRHNFFVIKKKAIIAVLCCLLILISFIVYFTAMRPAFIPKPIHTIVIDAGHGGIDGGAVGKNTQATESELNLQYALALKNVCEQFGFRVVLTRKDMSGLYNPLAGNKKRSEMEKRKEIIEKAKPDLVVSIHMNSFPSSEARGAQVYYKAGSQSGQNLAESVQESLFQGVENSKKYAKVGNFYILNCTEIPSILVECGFLSNPEEERLLQDKTYTQNFCYYMLCGILKFWNF